MLNLHFSATYFFCVLVFWFVWKCWFCWQTGAEWNEASLDVGSDAAQRAWRRRRGRCIQRLPRLWRQRRTTFCRHIRQLEHQCYGHHMLIMLSVTVSHCVSSSNHRVPVLLCLRIVTISGFYGCGHGICPVFSFFLSFSLYCSSCFNFYCIYELG